MENQPTTVTATAAHKRKASKKSNGKSKKNAIKVVYISNPMKVNTSASQFRSLVQQLTGQDAAGSINFTHTHDVGDATKENVNNKIDDDHHHSPALDHEVPKKLEYSSSSHLEQGHEVSDYFSFETFDDDL